MDEKTNQQGGNGQFLHATPLLDELEKGPWPSFISGFKKLAERTHSTMVRGVLDQLEYSYKTKMGYWKGGVVGVTGYGAGIISRFSMIPDKYPEAAEFHTVRVQPPPGFHYSTKSLRELMDLWEEYGCGIISMHGQTGNLQFQGITQDKVQEFFDKINEKGWDLGGAGACVRTGNSCVGEARCEMACYDTHKLHLKVLRKYTDDVHRPALPYKVKFKFSGCGNDCNNSIQRADIATIGTWRDKIEVDQAKYQEYVKAQGFEAIKQNVVDRCPTKCITASESEIKIDDSNCVHCMHCLNVMTKALFVGKDKGATVLIGGKGHLKVGNMLGSVLFPFIKLDTDAAIENYMEKIGNVIEWWSEAALDHERMGECIERIGMQTFLKETGMEADIDMIARPRDNPYFKADY
jgi:sulfite reductase alpha subunit